MKNKMTPANIILIVIVMIGLLNGLTSCKTSGYGCRGKESWNGMVKRINRQ